MTIRKKGLFSDSLFFFVCLTGFAIVLQELQTLQGKLTSPINLEAIDAKRQTVWYSGKTSSKSAPMVFSRI